MEEQPTVPEICHDCCLPGAGVCSLLINTCMLCLCALAPTPCFQLWRILPSLRACPKMAHVMGNTVTAKSLPGVYWAAPHTTTVVCIQLQVKLDASSINRNMSLPPINLVLLLNHLHAELPLKHTSYKKEAIGKKLFQIFGLAVTLVLIGSISKPAGYIQQKPISRLLSRWRV